MLAKDNVDNIIRAFDQIKDKYPNMDLFLYGTPNDKDAKVVKELIELTEEMLDLLPSSQWRKIVVKDEKDKYVFHILTNDIIKSSLIKYFDQDEQVIIE